QGSVGELLPLPIDASLVVPPRLPHRQGARPDRHASLSRVAVADDQRSALVVALAPVPLDVRLDLDVQSLGKHPPGALARQLVQRRAHLALRVVPLLDYPQHRRAFPRPPRAVQLVGSNSGRYATFSSRRSTTSGHISSSPSQRQKKASGGGPGLPQAMAGPEPGPLPVIDTPPERKTGDPPGIKGSPTHKGAPVRRTCEATLREAWVGVRGQTSAWTVIRVAADEARSFTLSSRNRPP